MRRSREVKKNWRDSSERAELRKLFAEADALVENLICDASTDCCRFGVTGREPYVTAAEVAELREGLKTNAKHPRKKRLDLIGEKRCPVLSDEGRCTAYDSRPLGCRTFFCQAALQKSGGAKLPHRELRRIAKDIEEISRQAFPDQPGTRPLTRVLT